MENCRSVLVVDGLSETEQVLKAVLEPRGLQVNRIRGIAERPARETPRLVVLHEDSTTSASADGDWGTVPRVVIGSARISTTTRFAGADAYFQKPFQYAELIQAVERLLNLGDPAT